MEGVNEYNVHYIAKVQNKYAIWLAENFDDKIW